MLSLNKIKWNDLEEEKGNLKKQKNINVLINKTGQRININPNKKPGVKKKKKINSSYLDKDDINWMLTEYYEIIKNDPKYKNKLEHLKKKIYRAKSQQEIEIVLAFCLNQQFIEI